MPSRQPAIFSIAVHALHAVMQHPPCSCSSMLRSMNTCASSGAFAFPTQACSTLAALRLPRLPRQHQGIPLLRPKDALRCNIPACHFRRACVPFSTGYTCCSTASASTARHHRTDPGACNTATSSSRRRNGRHTNCIEHNCWCRGAYAISSSHNGILCGANTAPHGIIDGPCGFFLSHTVATIANASSRSCTFDVDIVTTPASDGHPWQGWYCQAQSTVRQHRFG